MFPRVFSLRSLVVTGVALAAAGPAGAQLAAKSPFVAPQAAAATAATAGAPLEFRGFIATGEGMQFRVFDPAKKMGAWIKLNERNSEFDVVAKEYNDGAKTLIVEHQGRTLTLAERQAKVVSSGSAAQAMPPPPMPQPPSNVPAAVTQSVVLNPTPADEQNRLEAVASEVARRRALREQASQQISQGGQQQVAMPQQPLRPPVQPQRNIPSQQNPNSRGQNPPNQQNRSR
ncbi:MAG: hypothetical protein EXS37_00940 [Opitutus sp.]|nr:hypothetical protein [Opitutus sp.]